MPSAYGFVQSADSGSKFHAVFAVDDQQYSLSGRLFTAVGDFRSTHATLEFQDPSQLTGSQDVSGTISDSTLNLSLDNNTTVEAHLDVPHSSSSEISGSSIWSVS